MNVAKWTDIRDKYICLFFLLTEFVCHKLLFILLFHYASEDVGNEMKNLKRAIAIYKTFN